METLGHEAIFSHNPQTLGKSFRMRRGTRAEPAIPTLISRGAVKMLISPATTPNDALKDDTLLWATLCVNCSYC